jgi:hypothetical protein
VDKFKPGMVVRHTTLGIGRVVAVERAAVHVFFAGAEKKEAAKLSLVVASPFLEPAPSENDDRLENLPPFVLDPETGRYAPQRSRPAAAKRPRK